jgi:hypothetical protein
MLDNNGFTAHSLALLVLLQEYCRGLSADPDESQVGGVNVRKRPLHGTHSHSLTRTHSPTSCTEAHHRTCLYPCYSPLLAARATAVDVRLTTAHAATNNTATANCHNHLSTLHVTPAHCPTRSQNDEKWPAATRHAISRILVREIQSSAADALAKSFRSLYDELEGIADDGPEVASLVRDTLYQVQSPEAIFVLTEVFSELIVSKDGPAVIEPNSMLGLFVRRSLLDFSKMDFRNVSKLYRQVRRTNNIDMLRTNDMSNKHRPHRVDIEFGSRVCMHARTCCVW